jgi:tetratricopeptide (TPR) repeat protein
LAAIKEIAQIGATIGREFSYALLHAVTGRDGASLNSALSQLEEAELLFRTRPPPDVRYSFKHALVQDAAYESLLKSRRQILHRHIAEALRDRFPSLANTEPEIVAHHFTKSGLTEAAVEWWGKAGDGALRASAYKEAMAHFEKALTLADALGDEPGERFLRLRLQTTYGYVLLHALGQSAPETAAAFARAREFAAGIEDVTERASVYYGLWAKSRMELTQARELAEAFLADAQRWPGSSEASIAHRVFGWTCWFQGDYVRARTHLEQAVATYDDQRDRHLTTRFGYDIGVVATFNLALVLWPLGDAGLAAHHFEKGLALALETNHVPTIAYARFHTCLAAATCRQPRPGVTSCSGAC